MPKFYHLLNLFLLSMLLSACTSIAYYGQAINGHVRILTKRQPIMQLVEDPATDATLRKRLQLVVKMRVFASSDLALPDNASYKSYVSLDRPSVVWNIFAAPEFSLAPKSWCYPVAGCVTYRGYFSESRARNFAENLHQQGFDTEVSGVSAYSTLGWFSDPLLSTMMRRSDVELAGTLFHELAHQQLYVKNDTRFNESFAMVVELEGVRRWLQKQGKEKQYARYLQSLARKRQFIKLVQETRTQLEILYARDSDNARKRKAKAEIFLQLKKDYQQLKKSWGNYRGYDGWFDRKLTNASLVPISSYYDYVPAFQVLLLRNQNNIVAFYRDAHKLAKQIPANRKASLDQLTAAQTPSLSLRN